MLADGMSLAAGRCRRWRRHARRCYTALLMRNDTKWIVGSCVAVVAVVVTLAGDIRADLRDVRADLSTRIVGVSARIGNVRADLRDVRASMESFDARLRAIEVGFGKVDQSLLTIERVVLPASEQPSD